ncbi:MAG TPA: hypothetical protein VN437_05340, partial [Rectinemataceae bacterium]|nr:hypothetical protein [Rectinemataceae bacterium]
MRESLSYGWFPLKTTVPRLKDHATRDLWASPFFLSATRAFPQQFISLSHGTVAQEDDELIASIADDLIGAPDRIAQPVGDARQEEVPKLMAECVVDQLLL